MLCPLLLTSCLVRMINTTEALLMDKTLSFDCGDDHYSRIDQSLIPRYVFRKEVFAGYNEAGTSFSMGAHVVPDNYWNKDYEINSILFTIPKEKVKINKSIDLTTQEVELRVCSVKDGSLLSTEFVSGTLTFKRTGLNAETIWYGVFEVALNVYNEDSVAYSLELKNGEFSVCNSGSDWLKVFYSGTADMADYFRREYKKQWIRLNITPHIRTDIVFFEEELSAYPEWEFINIASCQNSLKTYNYDYYGNTTGSAKSSIRIRNIINQPVEISFMTCPESDQLTESFWYVKVSSDAKTWTQVGDAIDIRSIKKGNWFTKIWDLSEYRDVYVGIEYETENTIAAIDGLSLKYYVED